MRSHSPGARRQFTGTRATPAFAAAKYRIGYHGVLAARTAIRLPFPQPRAISRFAIRFAAAAASAYVSTSEPATANSAAGRSRAQ